jgi:hypothetical protein
LVSEFFDSHLRLVCDNGLKFGFLPKPFELGQFWAALNQLVGPSDHLELQANAKAQLEAHLQSEMVQGQEQEGRGAETS